MHHAAHDDPDAQPGRQQRQTLTLPLLMALGWLIYEVTAQPGLAAMAMCIKFGWEDFRTARWLYHTDPDRGRGRACYWIYLSSGLWKVAVTGLAMIFVIVVLVTVLQVQGPQARQAIPMLAGAGITLIFGFGFSALACFFALGSAHRHGVRLWLNGAVSLARQNGEWPPLYGQANRVLVLTITTVLVTGMMLIPAVLTWVCAALEGVVNNKLREFVLGLGSMASLLLLTPLMAIKLRDLRSRGFFADHPADCWGEGPVEPDGDTGVGQRYNDTVTP